VRAEPGFGLAAGCPFSVEAKAAPAGHTERRSRAVQSAVSGEAAEQAGCGARSPARLAKPAALLLVGGWRVRCCGFARSTHDGLPAGSRCGICPAALPQIEAEVFAAQPLPRCRHRSAETARAKVPR